MTQATMQLLCWADAQPNCFQHHGRSRRHGSRHPCAYRLRFDAARALHSPLAIGADEGLNHALHQAWRQPRASGTPTAKGTDFPRPARSARCSASATPGGDDPRGGHRHRRASAQRDGCAVNIHAGTGSCGTGCAPTVALRTCRARRFGHRGACAGPRDIRGARALIPTNP